MKIKLTPLAKGLITGALMIVVFLVPYFTGKLDDTSVYTYIIWAIFAAGIIWTLIDYRKSGAYTAKFGSLFKEGFRCFIVSVLALVLAMIVFFSANPQYREEYAAQVREYLVNEKSATGQPKYLPNEINDKVAASKKYYLVTLLSAYIFGYLILGSVITASGSAIIMSRKQ